MVANVFNNRLRKGMRLQCDPTVIYGLERMGRYQGTLTGKDLTFDSPYNTYEHGGLPPGPIGNPGEASMRAALHPAETNFLYFVAKDRKSTRLNSSHGYISYAVFCLKKKKKQNRPSSIHRLYYVSI